MIEKPEGKYLVDLKSWKGTAAEIYVNDQRAGLSALPPFSLDITRFIKPGSNKIEVNVLGSLKNLLGPHFNNPAPGFVSPWLWRNVRSYPPGKEYQVLDYGLFDDFVLLKTM